MGASTTPSTVVNSWTLIAPKACSSASCRHSPVYRCRRRDARRRPFSSVRRARVSASLPRRLELRRQPVVLLASLSGKRRLVVGGAAGRVGLLGEVPVGRTGVSFQGLPHRLLVRAQ